MGMYCLGHEKFLKINYSKLPTLLYKMSVAMNQDYNTLEAQCTN